MDFSQISDTQRKLLETGKELFSIYGFEGTSLRMIASAAGTNVAAMAFHFKNKENFYSEVLNYVANDMSSYFRSLEPWKNDADSGALSANDAFEVISAIIKEHIHTAIDLPEPAMIRLVYWEQTYAPGGVTPILNTIEKYSEQFLADLLEAFWKDSGISPAESRVISRLINGGIMSLGEHAVFLESAGKRDDPEWVAWVKETIYSFVMATIRGYGEMRRNTLPGK